jgi:hypothetical protein
MMGRGAGGSGPVEQYLGELRRRLRVRDAELILAEAEDHLREDVAAGVAAGLSEREAQLAAISSFGSVRAVLRAHQPRWRRAAAALSQSAQAVSRVAGMFLVTFSVAGLADLAWFAGRMHFILPAGVIIAHIAPGLVGLALLGAARLARRRSARLGGPDRAVRPARSAARAMLLYGGTGIALTVLALAGAIPLLGAFILTCLVLTLGYAIRLGTLRRRQIG